MWKDPEILARKQTCIAGQNGSLIKQLKIRQLKGAFFVSNLSRICLFLCC
jgi:hypothetical protein